MGYFDALAAGSFKNLENGKQAFYPWGRLGKGYELQTDEQYESIRRFVIRYYAASLVIGVALAVGIGWFAFAILPIGGLYFHLAVRRHLGGMPTASEKLSVKESYEAQARLHNPWILWAALIISLLFVCAGAVLLFGNGDLKAGLLVIGFFGACGTFAGLMLRDRRRLLRELDPEKLRAFD